MASNAATLLQKDAAQSPAVLPQPFSLPELKIVRGLLNEIQPFSSCQILASIGQQHVILPSEIEEKLKRSIGSKIEIMRLDCKYTIRRSHKPPLTAPSCSQPDAGKLRADRSQPGKETPTGTIMGRANRPSREA